MSYKEDMASVQQRINAARQERAQREYVEQVQTLQAEYRDNCANRAQATRDGNREEWDYWDSLCEQNERDLQAFLPVQAPEPHPAAQRWDYINKTFNERLTQRLGPQAAQQKLAEADAYITRPRNPRATSLAERGMGIARNSPAYFHAMESLLELYGESMAGTKFDPSEKALTPDESAKISGLSPRHFNQCTQQLINQGRIGRDD
jgi:hypothetical protein